MRIDRSRIRKTNSEVPAECQSLIERLRSCSKEELLEELKKIDTWTFGKCELYHWIDILDLCDSILEAAATRVNPKSWQICVDLPENREYKELVLWVLHFTTLLIEHSFSRHLYNSVEHLLTLLTSCDLNIVLNVLNLLYMFSKRSNYITRINPEKRNALLKCLTYLAESWGGEENGFGLADCVREGATIPSTATTLHYEFYTEDRSVSGTSQASCIHIENMDQLDKLPSEIMDGLIETFNVPKDGRMVLFTHLRLAHSFSNYGKRLKCVQARLQALSVLLYSNADASNLLYPGLLLELVQVLELNSPNFVEIRSAALRTLTSIIHLDRSPNLPKKSGSRLSAIIEATGAHLYHGFLPQLVRSCITSLTSPPQALSQPQGESKGEQFPLPLATALFSFLYHLASYETGGEALVGCGMMECLLRVINWPGLELEHITFVTRAVRVIDLITNIEMHSFQAQGGLNSFINRLQMEITICRQEQPFEIVVPSEAAHSSTSMAERTPPTPISTDELAETDEEIVRIAIDRVAVDSDSNPSCSKDLMPDTSLDKAKVPDDSGKATKSCLPQRAALLKSMLNFLKKALQDPVFSENIRSVMDGSLPNSLKHIISNAEYYGPSLFLLATDVVAVYVFQEPSLLSSLQDIGLTDVVLHALLIKKVPATREVLGSVPNVFSALCLNARGLNSFVKYKPFEKLFKVLLSPEYLPAMRRRRGSETIGDTASNLGNAMDELMRHQPSLKSDAIAAIIKLLEELCQLGSDPKYICWKPQKGSASESPNPTPRVSNEASSSDEEEEDEEEASTSSHPQREDTSVSTANPINEKTPIALVDYVLHVMKFVDAILSNNSTDDHCKEFVSQDGLIPLMSILGLPNLPVDYPITHTVQAVASVCKSVLSLAHDNSVMRHGLTQCNQVLDRLTPLLNRQEHDGTILLEELCKAPSMETAFSDPLATPLLHAMSAAYGYVIMFIHVCRTGQVEMRGLTMSQWSSNFGLDVLSKLSDLYISLVWESTVLLALCSDDSTNKLDTQALYPASIFKTTETKDILEELITDMDVINELYGLAKQFKQTYSIPPSVKLKYIKPLLAASSRLGRALAELFGLLVKLCVGIHSRARRANQLPNNQTNPRTILGHAVADALSLLLEKGLNHNHIPNSPIHKFRLTYLICSLGFTQPMLFDDKKYPYHLMLMKFLNTKGLDAFFATMKWVINFAVTNNEFNPDEIPEGTGEFLDAWLLLLEKLSNPKAVLETHHTIPNTMLPKCHRYSALFYLEYIHKMAFETLSVLWGTKPIPNYGPRMTETMITIYRHIIRGEMHYQERKQKEGDTTVAATTEGRSGRAPSGREHRPEVNPTELTQLMDMGFTQEHCYEALILTATLEHATDYLLNNFPHSQSSPSANVQVPADEIALQNFEPLNKEEITRFSDNVLNVCLNYVEILPETVFRISELLIVTIRRNGEKFCEELLTTLAENTILQIKELVLQIDYLNSRASGGLDDSVTSQIEEAMFSSLFAVRIAGYLHILMLIFEEVKVPCAQVIHSTQLLRALLTLLSKTTEHCGSGNSTPKWLAPLLLLIHQLEKVASCVTRKVNMHKVTVPVWRWLDLTVGKWTNYLAANNKLISEAYFRGDRDVVINNSRRRYRIVFGSMCQVNDDSGKARPVMMALIDPKDPQAKSNFDAPLQKYSPWTSPAFNSDDKDSDNTEALTDPEYYVEFYHRRGTLQAIDGLVPADVRMVLSACMTLLSKPVDPDTLHALMQVCVRYTRNYENARMVAKLGVVQRLLHLTQSSTFTGFVGLATMLIRHILEEPANITAAIERVIRFKTLHNIPPTFKELNYILRECAPAICRDPEIFKTVAKEIMRVDISILNKRSEEDDQRLLMKCLPADSQRMSGSAREVDILVKDTIIQLLNALVLAHQQELSEAAAQLEEQGSKSPQGSQQENVRNDEFYANPCLNSRNEMEPDVDTFNTSNLPMYIAATFPLSSYLSNNQKKSSTTTQHNSQPEKKLHLPLLTISNILKILGDAVRSYSCIAKMITDHKYSSKQSDIIKEECSAVAFVLDQLMPWKEDQDRQNMSRNLLAALASCNHSPDAQCALVTEVKAALTRTLLWPESTKKHTHIQDLMAVVTTMIENCPPVPISSTPLSAAIKLNQYSVNNMVRFMMRKGIVTDLARIPLCLDLSSPKMPATMNAALKPLETLSRIMSQPSGNSSSPTKGKPKTGPGGQSSQTPASIGNTNSEANQVAQMDHSGVAASGEGGDDDNVDMDAQPELINAMINRVVGSMNDMGGLMQNVIERNRMPNLRMERRRRSRGQNRVISELTRFGSIFSSSSDLNNFSNNEEMSQESSSDDSDSNPMDEGRHIDDPATDIDDNVEDDDDDDDEEDDDEDEDDDDDEEQEGDGNEGEESNGAYNEDGLGIFEPEEGLFRIPALDRDTGDEFLMIEYSEPDPTAQQPWSRDSFFPFTIYDDGANLEIGSNRVPAQHPLLTARQSVDQPSASSGTRSQRMSRTRRYQYVQMNRAAVASPVFLQRLMSQSTSEPPNYLNIPGHPGNTYGEMLTSTFPNTRLIVLENGLGILTNSEEEQINFVDNSGYLVGPSLAATLNNVPASMYWWNEELRLLDRESVCDCAICTSVAFELVPEFERFRNEEFAERKGKRKKIDEEEDSNKKASGSTGETEKKKLYDGIMDMFEPTPRPPTRNQPARRIAMLSAAQEVAQATESLAGSIVESVLHPRPPPTGPPQSPPAPQRPSIPEALELIPVGPSDPAPLPELSDPTGLIPGSVPYTPPSDPDDGFFRVNSAPSESSIASSIEFSRQSPDYIPPPPPTIPINELNQNRQRETDEPAAPAPVPAPAPQEVAANVDVPEGVDPSFLAALPEEMRAEVVSEHLRLQRLQSRVQQNSQSSEDASQQSSTSTEVNPDFLAALPPAIQEEVLAQQRLEQQRLANPNDPVDAAAFFQDLPHSLRQAILTDMEESQMAALPPDLAAEAQNLRREWEARNRQIMQERFLTHVTHSTSALSSILRHTTAPRNIRRPTGPRYTIQNMGPGNRSHWLSTWNLGARLLDGSQSQSGTNTSVISRPRGRQVLDYESICCLLVLLFVDDPRINTARLHRVFRNLCYHQPTRDWLIKAVLSIMEKSNEGHDQVGPNESGRRVTRSQSQQSPEHQPSSVIPSSSSSTSATRSGSSWLNISMDAALGCRATVFHVHKNPGRRNDKSITINSQAAPLVYGHALEILISLARIFPSYFMPGKSSGTATPSPKTTKCPRADNFWDLLVRLDSLSTSKKGKTMVRPSGGPPPTDSENLSLESSPFGQLLKMLASPVVRRSPLLMDKLLRLLSHISISLHVRHQRLWEKVECNPDTIKNVSLVISVLISNTCSEEGLEDATALLLNLTISLPSARSLVFEQLIEGAYQLGLKVCEDIDKLWQELRMLNSQQSQQDEIDDQLVDSNKPTSLKGILSNRFTKDTVVVTAPKKVKAGLDLQLTSMAPLISKTSNQAFFLRILKVIVQLKDAVRNFEKKRQKDAAEEAARSTEQNTSNAESQQDSQNTPPPAPVAAEPVPEVTWTPMDASPQGYSAFDSSPTPERKSKPVEVCLSDQLNLTKLWDTLSECLTELQHTQDSHAVLVLQPAVEAFFLVYASSMETEQTSADPSSDRGSANPPFPSSQSPAESQQPQEQNSQSSTERDVWQNSSPLTRDSFPAVWSIGDEASQRSMGFSQDSQQNTDEPAASGSSPPMDVQDAIEGVQERQQGLGLEGLSSTPPPVSPLPSDSEAVNIIPAYQFLSSQGSSVETQPYLSKQQRIFLTFAEKHRTVLNQILRQSSTPLLEGPFKVLVNHTRVLDFDVKRRYFRSELERADEGHRREELAVHVRRTQVFEESFRELHRRNPEEWKNRFYIVFEGEEGQDAGGLLREWYMIISREIFNPMYALFKTSPGDRVTYMINPASDCNPNHLSYFKFVGRVIAKAIYDNKLLECYFTRSFYKHILGIQVKYTDMESEDYSFYKGLEYLMENPVASLGYEVTFSTEVQEFGVTEVRELIPNGRNIEVNEKNKMQYIRLVCQMKMTGNIRKQLNAFLEGFYDIIPKKLISIFNEQELELLISGLPNVDIEDLRANTEYYKYQPNSLQIQWFWRALRDFDQAERAKFLQFVTGTSKVPLQGFGALEGMNGTQKFQIHRDERSTERLPSAHTCFNQLDLPVYETFNRLKDNLLKAIHECSEGFGFA